jgi:predicted PurR-regulated permease PerM
VVVVVVLLLLVVVVVVAAAMVVVPVVVAVAAAVRVAVRQVLLQLGGQHAGWGLGRWQQQRQRQQQQRQQQGLRRQVVRAGRLLGCLGILSVWRGARLLLLCWTGDSLCLMLC